MAKFVAVRDHVLVEPLTGERKTEGGLYIAEGKVGEMRMGIVVSVGLGLMQNGVLVPVDVKPGMKVIYYKHAKNDVIINDKKYFVMRASDIVGYLDESQLSEEEERKFKESLNLPAEEPPGENWP